MNKQVQHRWRQLYAAVLIALFLEIFLFYLITEYYR
jgi:hypothetical protein